LRKTLALATILTLTAAACGAQSTTGTGQWLHELWMSDQKVTVHEDQDWIAMNLSREYRGFVTGAAEVMYDARWLDLSPATWGQLFAVVGAYLDANPDQWSLKAQILVFRALYAAWPGPQGAASPYLPGGSGASPAADP